MRAPIAISRSGMMALYQGIIQMIEDYKNGNCQDSESQMMQIEDALDDFRAATLQPLLDDYQELLEGLDDRLASSVMQLKEKEQYGESIPQ